MWVITLQFNNMLAPSGTFYGSAIFHGQKLLTFAGRDLQSQYYDELKLCTRYSLYLPLASLFLIIWYSLQYACLLWVWPQRRTRILRLSFLTRFGCISSPTSKISKPSVWFPQYVKGFKHPSYLFIFPEHLTSFIWRWNVIAADDILWEPLSDKVVDVVWYNTRDSVR